MLIFATIMLVIGTALVSVGLTVKVMEARRLRDAELDGPATPQDRAAGR